LQRIKRRTIPFFKGGKDTSELLSIPCLRLYIKLRLVTKYRTYCICGYNYCLARIRVRRFLGILRSQTAKTQHC